LLGFGWSPEGEGVNRNKGVYYPKSGGMSFRNFCCGGKESSEKLMAWMGVIPNLFCDDINFGKSYGTVWIFLKLFFVPVIPILILLFSRPVCCGGQFSVPNFLSFWLFPFCGVATCRGAVR
jgi:hypothetical protein